MIQGNRDDGLRAERHPGESSDAKSPSGKSQGLGAIMAAIDSLPDAMLVLDTHGRVSHFNSALVTLYGDAARLLNVGHRYQQVTDWHLQSPALARGAS